MAAKGDGITKRKDGRYVGRYTVHTPDGPKRKTIYGRKYGEVERKLAEARGDAARGIFYEGGETTVGEYLEAWLGDSVLGTVRQRTYERYETDIRVHLKPSALGRVKLKALNAAHVRALHRLKLDSGLAPRSVRNIHRTLSKALKQAVSDGLIPRNACDGVACPKPHGEEVRPLGRNQVRALFEAARGDRLEALYTVAVTTGLRRGEIQALRWSDVDLDTGYLRVRRTLSEARSGTVFENPKSGKGRGIRLSQKAIQSLRAHRQAQNEERLRLGPIWEDSGLAFTSRIGTYIGGGNLHRAFKKMLTRAGLPEETRFHDLRHTCATLLLTRGVHPKVVQELLGHADIALTLNVYSHVLPDMGGAAAGAMDDAL